MRRRLLLCLTLSLCLAPHSWADRGSIPFTPNVKVFEPVQRAMIAWNGEGEILVLSTDLMASETTKVLEVLPLPSEPRVTKGDVELFRKARSLINGQLRAVAKGPGGGSAPSEASRPAGEITFHERIGAHDISVARVVDPTGFVQWVNDYLNKAGVATPVVPETLKAAVQEYIREKFTWFVFDVVDLDGSPKTNDAIQYRFKADALFYPLKISRTDEGQTSIDLLVLTPRLLSSFPGIGIERVELVHPPVSLTSEELRSLNPDIDALLGHREDMKLRIWRIRGSLRSFDNDLVAR